MKTSHSKYLSYSDLVTYPYRPDNSKSPLTDIMVTKEELQLIRALKVNGYTIITNIKLKK